MSTNLLNQYLSEAVKGNAEAAFKAGKFMANEGLYNEVAIQSRYQEAAEAGFTEAQKELGALGLCGRLITDDSTAFNISYYNDYNIAMEWLKKAARNGDAESTIVVEAVEKYGTSIIDNARAAIEFYKENLCSESFTASPAVMLFEVTMQYLKLSTANKVIA